MTDFSLITLQRINLELTGPVALPKGSITIVKCLSKYQEFQVSLKMNFVFRYKVSRIEVKRTHEEDL